jgi:hypothetical protein
LMRCSIFIAVMNTAEQHNMVIFKQAQRQTIWHGETSPVLFDLRRFKVDYLSFAPHSCKFPQYSVRSHVTL